MNTEVGPSTRFCTVVNLPEPRSLVVVSMINSPEEITISFDLVRQECRPESPVRAPVCEIPTLAHLRNGEPHCEVANADRREHFLNDRTGEHPIRLADGRQLNLNGEPGEVAWCGP